MTVYQEPLEGEALQAHRNFRQNEWVTKDNRRIPICELKGSQKMAAYKRSGDQDLFKEMVVRLFEQRIGQ